MIEQKQTNGDTVVGFIPNGEVYEQTVTLVFKPGNGVSAKSGQPYLACDVDAIDDRGNSLLRDGIIIGDKVYKGRIRLFGSGLPTELR